MAINSNAPGIYVGVSTSSVPISSIPFNTVHIVGSASSGPYTPTLVQDVADFQSQFAGSTSLNAVSLYFAEKINPDFGLTYFTRVGVAARSTVTVNAAATTDYTVTINGTVITYAGTASQTTAQIASSIVNAINTNATASLVVTASIQGGAGNANKVIVRAKNVGAAITVTVSQAELTAAVTTPTTPDALDFVNTFTPSTFDADGSPAFLICPEVASMNDADRQSVRNAMVALAGNEALQWFAILDAGIEAAEASVQQVAADRLLAPSSRFAAYVGDHVFDNKGYTDSNGVSVPANRIPASPAIVAAAFNVFSKSGNGIQTPFAGSSGAFLTVTGVARRRTVADSEFAALNQINLIRFRKSGYQLFDCLTLSTDPNFKFIHTSLITSSILLIFRNTYDPYLFNSLGNQGQTIIAMEDVASKIFGLAYDENWLYGGDKGRAGAYRVRHLQQDPNQLEQGRVSLKAYFVPSLISRQIVIDLVRTPAGGIQAAISQGL